MQYFVLKPVTIAPHWLVARQVDVPIEQALGAVLAQDVCAECDVPAYSCALRDGWAVASSDDPATRERADWSVENGQAAGRLAPGQAVWVNTGGALPIGADAVIADDGQQSQAYRQAVRAGTHVALQGSQWRAHTRILRAADRVGAMQAALLCEAGIDSVRIHAYPVVGIVSTGSEMRSGAQRLGPACARACSNATYIAALMRRIGVQQVHEAVVADNTEAIATTLRKLDAHCDIIITIGGTGRGRRDYTRAAVLAAGGRMMGNPGDERSPFVLARLQQAAMIGLPGNPLAAIVLVQRLLVRTIRAVFHLPEVAPQRIEARITQAIEPGSCGELCVRVTHHDTQCWAQPLAKGGEMSHCWTGQYGVVQLCGQAYRAGQWVQVELMSN